MKISIKELRKLIREAITQDAIVPGRWGGDGSIDKDDEERIGGRGLASSIGEAEEELEEEDDAS
jgi:hypothetical protein